LAGIDKLVAWFFRIAIEEREIDRREFLTGSGGPIALASTSAVAGAQSAREKALVASVTIHRIQVDGAS
jgi:hypothetical protein